ncbi:hypothetical protein LEP1GSC163_2917 [Leptospira santarosai str. CBC379]|nr:hypothetical protein LEP1GSC163_2917 [Leptospira santarosai str. CBC379]
MSFFTLPDYFIPLSQVPFFIGMSNSCILCFLCGGKFIFLFYNIHFF